MINPFNQTNKLSKYTGILVNVVVILIFIFLIARFCRNYPNAFDDIYIFITQFKNQFLLERNGFIDKIAHFFKVTHAPHPKLSSRLINYFTYLFCGEVNFSVIKIIGNLGLIALLYVLGKTSKLGLGWYLVPVTCLLLVPVETTIWAIFVSGFPFLILCVLAAFINLVKQNYGLFALFLLLAIYQHGSGFICCVICVYYLVIQQFYKKSELKATLSMTGITLISAAIFFAFTYQVPSNTSDALVDHSLHLISRTIYLFNFMAMAASKYLIPNNYHHYGYILGALVSIPIIKSNLQILANRSVGQVKLTITLLANFILCVMIMAAFLRFSGTINLYHKVAPRYELYSALFIALSYMIVMIDLEGSKWKTPTFVSILALSLVLFGLRMRSNVPLLDKSYYSKIERTFHRLDGNVKLSYVKLPHTKNLVESYKDNLYRPKFKELLSPIRPWMTPESNAIKRTNNGSFMEVQQFDETILLLIGVPKSDVPKEALVYVNIESSDRKRSIQAQPSRRKEFMTELTARQKRYYKVYQLYFNYKDLELAPGKYPIEMLVIDRESNINEKKSYFYPDLNEIRIGANEY